MARTHAAASRQKSKSTRRSSSSRMPMALTLLKQDHQTVDKLFKQADKAKSSEKANLVATICQELTVHARIEEEIFYPALRDADVESDLLDEADVEHQGIKRLVGELEAMEPGDELYDAKVTVLSEYVKHHVKEEETELFPKARKSSADLDEIGQQLEIRKEELKGRRDA
jgi:hemerythrin superfamily protein